MSQSNFYGTRSVTQICIEGAYCTAGTPLRAAIDPTKSSITRTRLVVQVPDERTRAFQHIDPILGPKSAQAAIAFDMRPAIAQYDKNASPADHYLQQLLKALMGGHSRAAGSAVVSSSGSPVNSITLTTGHGTRFPIGTEGAVTVNGSLEYFEVIGLATDTITVYPPLTASPSVGADVFNSDTFYLTQTNTQTLCVQHAKVEDSNFAWTLNGATGDFELALDAEKILQVVAKLVAPLWTFSSAAGASPVIPTTAFTETLASQLMGYATTCLFQPTSTTTKVHVPFEQGGFSSKWNLGMSHIKQLGGAYENTSGVLRQPMRPAVEVGLKLPADTQYEAAFTNRTAYYLKLIFPWGSGTTQRAVIVRFPCVRIVEQPEHAGDRVLTSLALHAFENALTTGTTDLALSPGVIALV